MRISKKISQIIYAIGVPISRLEYDCTEHSREIMKYAIKLLVYPSSQEKSIWLKAVAEHINDIGCYKKRKIYPEKIKKWLYEERDALSHYYSVIEDMEEERAGISFSQIQKNIDEFYDFVALAVAENCNRKCPGEISEKEINDRIGHLSG